MLFKYPILICMLKVICQREKFSHYKTLLLFCLLKAITVFTPLFKLPPKFDVYADSNVTFFCSLCFQFSLINKYSTITSKIYRFIKCKLHRESNNFDWVNCYKIAIFYCPWNITELCTLCDNQ